jgi:peptidoglycan/LPS O-acetylase OafA/YrhL
LGFILIVVAFVVLVGHHFSGVPHHTVWRLLHLGIPALLLLAGVVMVEADGGMPSNKFFLHLADASYSIYAVHGLTIVISHAIILKFGMNIWLELITLSATALACSLLAYRYIDKPLNDWIMTRKLTPSPSSSV